MELIFDFILVMGTTITILIFFLLIRQKNKQLPQRILIILFVFFLMLVFHFYSILNEARLLQLITFIPRDTIRWVIGPLMLLYVRSLFLSKKDLYKNMLFHFIPFIVFLLFLSIPTLINDCINSGQGKPLFKYLEIHFKYGDREADLMDVYMIFYFILIFKQLSKYKLALKSNYSNLTSNDFNWINHFLIGGIVVGVLDLILGAYTYFYQDPGFIGSFFVIVAFIILISYLGYHGTSQSTLLLPGFLLKEESLNSQQNNRLSSCSSHELTTLTLNLENVLKNEKPYLDPNLTLAKMADFIQISDKKLSALLNQHMNISFFDLVNKYRVAEVKKRLVQSENQNLTLLGIAFECGFNSKTSFNRIFKKETGLSPSEYKNNLQNN